jgi:hypothetical protein
MRDEVGNDGEKHGPVHDGVVVRYKIGEGK